MTVIRPASTVTSNPDEPWNAETAPPAEYDNISVVIFPIGAQRGFSSWMPRDDAIVEGAKNLVFMAAADFPDGVNVKTGWQIEKPDGELITILTLDVIAPDATSNVLFIAQVSG